VRSVTSIDSQPNEQFASATISKITDSRNWVEADVDVPSGDRPALLTFSRPYFRGYEARLGNQKLAVGSYRGLFPVLEVPPGAHGRLILTYRPYWLIWGGAVTVVCAVVIGLSFLAAINRRT
jgi:arabinofuranan 3-O-arabinosyltransferase